MQHIIFVNKRFSHTLNKKKNLSGHGEHEGERGGNKAHDKIGKRADRANKAGDRGGGRAGAAGAGERRPGLQHLGGHLGQEEAPERGEPRAGRARGDAG